ncbi:MAG: hypothetical protein UT63_C0051G0016 [Candidatus Gottesmanbacteria bacterium GW2011_GWC2_39_8]|uniref:Glycosyltransferase 2-like domain-containing protein n=1 Tax=Candidatus Gottesmanbacteria bacterium GW2011_GWC2_39_8 TaxID=1618450 RepID=A0A0G0PVF7_9BACT|nr:MAG: hypothetical protein UT63_C0051G0016 [Candidatus Gottesmanbacteria bacterium GW2011_GWC2_39_8]
MRKNLEVLIPTFNRTTALTLTLLSLVYQEEKKFDLIISDQGSRESPMSNPSFRTVIRLLEIKGHYVKFIHRKINKGIAEQRQYLLDKVKAKYCLYLDDDLILEKYVLKGLFNVIKKEKCGFVGRAVTGLSFARDKRQDQQDIEFWREHVETEKIMPGDRKWFRFKLHNAANLYHVEKKMKISSENQKIYKVAWVGGCVMYDTLKLRSVGGFEFWKQIPKNHSGEEVYVQLKLMEKYGGCGVIPSGVYHQELPTTIKDRSVNIPELLFNGFPY